jgi:hypothetical protein
MCEVRGASIGDSRKLEKNSSSQTANPTASTGKNLPVSNPTESSVSRRMRNPATAESPAGEQDNTLTLFSEWPYTYLVCCL